MFFRRNKINKAMIMAAGVGSRLEPLTLSCPKPIAPVANLPVMDILLKHLSSYGIKNVVANTHYRADDIINRYTHNSPVNINIKFSKEDELSGTAGGLKKCQYFFKEGENFFVLSSDGLTDFEVDKATDCHIKSGAIATIITKAVPRSEVYKYGVVVTDKDGYVTSFQEKPVIEDAKSNIINTGIYVFKYDIFNYIPENTFYDFAKNVFPVLMAKNLKINTYTTHKYWSDIGSFSQYKQSNSDILTGVIKINGLRKKFFKNGVCAVGKKVIIDENATIKGECSLGDNCVVEAGALLENSVLWDNVTIEKGVTVKNSIVASRSVIKTSIDNEVIGADVVYDKTCETV